MAASELESVWELISKVKFDINKKSLPAKLTCGICEKLMIDACQSTCGCQYCYKCISDYLGSDHTYCPGGKEDCQYEHLVLYKTFFRNQVLNKNIMKVVVRCPNESCECDIELAQMMDHLRVCTKQEIKCPFAQIGCDREEASKDTILTHLSSDTFGHSELLIELFHNLRNEVDQLKDSSNISKLDISTLKEESRKKDTQIKELIVQMEEQRREMQGVKEESKIKEKRIVTLEKELREVKKDVEVRLSTMKTDAGERETRMEEQRRSIEHVRREIREERENSLKKVREMSLVTDKRMNNLVTFFPNVDLDFVWRFRECSKMETKSKALYEIPKGDNIVKRIDILKKEGLLSDSFYSNEYHLCLMVGMTQGEIVLCCHILKGDNDDRVRWPMRLSVTLGIVNRDTLRTHKSVTLQYDSYKLEKNDFNRPTEYFHDNTIVGQLPGVYSSIKHNKSVVLDDSVILSCVLHNS